MVKVMSAGTINEDFHHLMENIAAFREEGERCG